MMVPTMMATFWLLLRPCDGAGALEGVGEDSDLDMDVDAGIGVAVGGEGEDVKVEVEVEVEVRDVGTVEVEDKVDSDERILDVGEPVVEFAIAPDAADTPLEFVSVHTWGFCP